jgi:hypothetical protein
MSWSVGERSGYSEHIEIESSLIVLSRRLQAVPKPDSKKYTIALPELLLQLIYLDSSLLLCTENR